MRTVAFTVAVLGVLACWVVLVARLHWKVGP